MGGKILDIGIFEFVNAIKGNNLLLINIFLTLGVIFVNGFTDAPNLIRCFKKHFGTTPAKYFKNK